MTGGLLGVVFHYPYMQNAVFFAESLRFLYTARRVTFLFPYLTPRANSATAENRRQPATGPPDAPQPVQPSSTPLSSISQPAGTKRKRPQDSEAEAEANELEDVRPCKQPRELPPPRAL